MINLRLCYYYSSFQKLMEKIAVSHPIHQAKIVSTIEYFISKLNHNDLFQNFQRILKHPLTTSISCAIDPKFIANCVHVCVSFQLSNVVKGVQQLCTKQNLQEMRDFYFYMSTQGAWKSQFQYQRSILCIIRIVSDFFNQTFSDITVDDKLESQIYVILIYVLMGIKVGTKSFYLLQKKYLKSKEELNEKNSYQKRQRRTQRKPMVSKTNKRQSISASIFNRTQPTIARMNSIHPQTPKSPTDMFIETLKQDLYVSPLPQITKQKKSLESFSIQKCQLSQFNSTAGCQIFKQPQQKCKKFPFLSNQLSVSMHSEIIQRHVSIAEHSKPLKIKYRSPNFSSHLVVFKNKVTNQNENLDEYNLLKQKQKQEKWKLSSQEWKKIITNLKQNFIKKQQKTENMNQFRRNYRQYDCQIPPKQLQKRREKLSIRQPNLTQISFKSPSSTTINDRKTHEIDSQCSQSIEGGVRNFKQVFLAENENYFGEKMLRINKSMLREQKKQFDQQVLLRHEKIKYTMFMLPKMNKKNTHIC